MDSQREPLEEDWRELTRRSKIHFLGSFAVAGAALVEAGFGIGQIINGNIISGATFYPQA